jgi:hypothetical protein
LVIGLPAALGAPVAATLDKSEVSLVDAANGGWSATVGLTNITDSDLSISAQPTTAACDLEVGDGTAVLPAAQHAELTVSIPAMCEADDGIAFVLTASATGVNQRLPVTASPKSTPAVFWSSLLSFPVALLASFVLVAIVYLVWRKRTRNHGKESFRTPLKGLEATWSFKDSMVSNLTAASGLVVLVLGSSEFLKTVLGKEAESAIGVAAIAGAIALALVGAAAVLVFTLKKPSERYITIGGLCAATVVGLGAAGGQVWSLTILVSDLDLGLVGQALVWVGCVLASALLFGYAFVSLYGLLEKGTKASDTPPPVEVIAAAITAAATTHRDVSYAKVTELLEGLRRPKGTKGIVIVPEDSTQLPMKNRSALL